MIKEMNAKQEAKFNMFRATEMHVDDNAAIVAANVAFTAAFNQFKTTNVAISGTAQQKSGSLLGIAVDKTNYKQTLCTKTAAVAGYIYAYAAANKNNTLKSEMNLSITTLMRTRDEELAPRCQNVHDKGAVNIAALKDYGVTAALLADLQTAITDYSASTPRPRAAVSSRKTATVNLAALFKENDAILNEQMDKLIEQFRADHPNFVKTYFSNREIIDAPTKTKRTADKKNKDADK